MKKKRKEELMHNFPSVPAKLRDKMHEGRKSANYCVFLTNGHELFVRCFHRYGRAYRFCVEEVQRYVFARDGYVRYGIGKQGYWTVRQDFREPVFYHTFFGYSDNSYIILNDECISSSDLRYCPHWNNPYVMEFLRFYVRHPRMEYLFKAGYGHLITRRESYYCGYYNIRGTTVCEADIDWKSNDLLKMLHLNRTEFRLLRGHETGYSDYIYWRSNYPKMKPEELMIVIRAFHAELGSANLIQRLNGRSIVRTARYLLDQNISTVLYRDYLYQCRELQYDMHDTAICFPHDFHTMHIRLSALIQNKEDEKARRSFAEHYEKRKEFEYSFGDLILIQPEKLSDIINEGKALCHCVGGYAKRHANGSTNIFFIRRISEPDKPYYTIEVSNSLKIIQCHGYRNDAATGKPEEIRKFEREYTKYLEGLKNERIKHAI